LNLGGIETNRVSAERPIILNKGERVSNMGNRLTEPLG